MHFRSAALHQAKFVLKQMCVYLLKIKLNIKNFPDTLNMLDWIEVIVTLSSYQNGLYLNYTRGKVCVPLFKYSVCMYILMVVVMLANLSFLRNFLKLLDE